MPSEPASHITTAFLEGLTARVRAYRIRRSMGRLSKLLEPARRAQDGLERAVGEDVRKYVERVEHIHKRRDDIFMAKHAELDAAVSDLANFEVELEDFGKNSDSSGAYRGTGGEHG